MAKTGLSITRRPPTATVQYAVVRDEVKVGMTRVGKAGVASYKRVVANFAKKNRPDFDYTVGIGPKRMFVRVFPKGTDNQLKIWKLIDKTGAKRHKIRAKKQDKRGRYLLYFEWGGPGSYDAKTKPSPARFGGSGKVQGGRLIAKKEVNHPGFRPRKFSEALNKDLKPTLGKEIQNGLRRGLRKAKRG